MQAPLCACIVGAQGCGKTSLVNRFIADEFVEERPTIGSTLKLITAPPDATVRVLSIWDVGGDAVSLPFAEKHIETSDFILYAFAPTDDHAQIMKQIIKECQSHAKAFSEIVVVATKSDIASPAQLEKIATVAKGADLECFAVSAKNDTGVQEVFDYLVRQVNKKFGGTIPQIVPTMDCRKYSIATKTDPGFSTICSALNFFDLDWLQFWLTTKENDAA